MGKPDIRILVGVEGGASISGESGKLIRCECGWTVLWKTSGTAARTIQTRDKCCYSGGVCRKHSSTFVYEEHNQCVLGVNCGSVNNGRGMGRY